MYRTLVVGEQPEACQALTARLGALGYDAHSAPFDSIATLRTVFAVQPDVIIFDADAADSPRELFHTLLTVSQLPVLVIGSGLSSDELVWYLDGGAAAYAPKPISATAVAARVKSLLRRREPAASPNMAIFGNVAVDRERREVRREGRILTLTPTEFRLLEVLLENADRPCSQRVLLQRVWGEDFIGYKHYLRLYIGYLRSKLEADPANPLLLVTEWGVGYRLVTRPTAARTFGVTRRAQAVIP